MADYSAKIAQARKAGYSDAEIVGFLSKGDQKVQTAMSAGYDPSEIIGHISKPVAAPKAAPQKTSIYGEIAGGLANLNRGLLIGDELAGGVTTARNLLSGRSKIESGNVLGSLGTAFRQGMADQRGVEDRFTAERPIAAALARGTGNAATVAIPGGGATVQGGRAMNMLRGATSAALPAAAMGAADRGTGAERLRAASTSAMLGGALGAAGGALSRPARAVRAGAAPTAQNTLRQAGVSLTPGQQLGGVVKSVEDLAQRAPILGPAIRGARERGRESLVRAVANRTLEPIGEVVPANVKTGHEAVGYVEKRLGKIYDEAADMVPVVRPDEQFATARQAIDQSVQELNPDVAVQFGNILKNRVDPILAKPEITGRDIRSVQKQIGKIAAEKGSSGDEAQRALGDVLESLNDELKGLLARANPDAGALISTANKGWQSFVRLRKASASASADGKFTAGQLATAVRQMDKSVGKGRVAKGEAVLQDLSSAASQVMPDAFGNPGTADAVGLGALGMGVITAPAQAIPAAMGLGAAAVPYMMMGRKIVTELPTNATRGQIQEAADQLAVLAQKDPKVATLYRQFAERFGLPVTQNQPKAPIEINVNRSTNPEFLARQAERNRLSAPAR